MTEKKPMSGSVFFDTNIIIYAYSEDEPTKQTISNTLIGEFSDAIISTQVINELSNTLFRKFKLSAQEIRKSILELSSYFSIVSFSTETQLYAIEIKEKYQLQYYDALIIATALETNCDILFSEDMQHNQTIKSLQIINPYK